MPKDKGHTPENPYRGPMDKIFDLGGPHTSWNETRPGSIFTKQNTPAGEDKKIDGTKRRRTIDEAVEKAGG